MLVHSLYSYGWVFFVACDCLTLMTKRPPAESWWVQKLSADLTAD
jgi:hypothetical protein